MGASQQLSSSLSCQLRIKEAKNAEYLKSTGKLFVRYYLSAGNGRRIRLETKEIPASSDGSHVWDESISLECEGGLELEKESVVFELRWRSSTSVPVFGRRSRVLSKAVVPWKEILQSPNMVLDKWITMVPQSGGVKPVKLAVEIRVGAQAKEEKRKQRRSAAYMEEKCSCKYGHGYGHGCTCADYDAFAFVAALEAF